MEAYRKMLEAKVAENRKKSEDHRRKVIAEKNKAFEGYVEPEWTSLQGLEHVLKDIEAKADDYYDNETKKGKNRKKKNRNQKDVDEDEDENGLTDATDGDCQVINGEQQKVDASQSDLANGKDNPVNQDDDDDDEEEIGQYCSVCNKKFKTIKSFQNHEKSKKHLTQLEAYKARLEEYEEDEDE